MAYLCFTIWIFLKFKIKFTSTGLIILLNICKFYSIILRRLFKIIAHSWFLKIQNFITSQTQVYITQYFWIIYLDTHKLWFFTILRTVNNTEMRSVYTEWKIRIICGEKKNCQTKKKKDLLFNGWIPLNNGLIRWNITAQNFSALSSSAFREVRK